MPESDLLLKLRPIRYLSWQRPAGYPMIGEEGQISLAIRTVLLQVGMKINRQLRLEIVG